MKAALVPMIPTLALSLVSFGAGAFGHARQPASSPEQRPNLMAAMGDSLSAAALADTYLPIQGAFGDEAPTEAEEEELLHQLIESTDAPEELREGILWQNKSTYSWASGERVDSHFARLAKYRSGEAAESLAVANVAENGARAEDMPAQAGKIVKFMASGKYKSLLYVTLLVGSNDACSGETRLGTPAKKVRESLLSAFEKLASIRQPERIRVLVSLLPRIQELGHPRIRDARTLLGIRCGFLRNRLFHLCDPLLTWESEAERSMKEEVVFQKNLVIAATVMEAQERFPGLDIHLSEGLSSLPLSLDLLAIDCFHPNRKGQRLVAELLWAEQPWFRHR